MSDVGLFNSAAVGVDYAHPGTDPKPEPPVEPAPKVFDPSEHTVAEVEEFLHAHPDQRDAVLAAEAAGKARTTLVGDA